jgi:hypothetical protein
MELLIMAGRNVFEFLRTQKGVDPVEDTQDFIIKISRISLQEFKMQVTSFLKTADEAALKQIQLLATLLNLKSFQTTIAQKRWSTEIQKNLVENLNYLETLRIENQFWVPQKKTIVVWDIDGPINHGKSRSEDDCYEPEFRNAESERGEDPVDFIVANKPFLKLTLDVLDKNNVISVIGSQRIQMSEDNKFLQSMYQGLDYIFDKDRAYLKEAQARKIGWTLQDEETNKSKNKLLKAYQNEFRVVPESIIFIDDNENYREPAEQADFVFVYAPRRAEPGSIADNAYLYETLLRAIPAHNIYKAITSSKADPVQKNEFKKQLLIYQLDNLSQVTSWQSKVLVEEKLLGVDGEEDLPNENDKVAKALLQGIQFLIMDTNWEIGYFGGEKIVDSVSGISNTIPEGMNLILKEIDKAQKETRTWRSALNHIEYLVHSSAHKKDHGFFNKRGETSQIFYDKTKDMLKELREQERQKDNDNSPSQRYGSPIR